MDLSTADRKLAAGLASATGDLGPVVCTGNRHVHPAFAGVLAAFCPPAAQLDEIKRAAYVQALKNHDWSFEFSDDGAAHSRGRESWAQLKLAQRELDPKFEVWNLHCHPACLNGAAYQ